MCIQIRERTNIENVNKHLMMTSLVSVEYILLISTQYIVRWFFFIVLCNIWITSTFLCLVWVYWTCYKYHNGIWTLHTQKYFYIVTNYMLITCHDIMMSMFFCCNIRPWSSRICALKIEFGRSAGFFQVKITFLLWHEVGLLVDC